MSGPKHLWSGDWERESDAANRRQGARQSRPADPQEPSPRGPSGSDRPPSRRRSLARPLVIVGALVLITGVALGLNALISGGGSHAASTPTVASAPTATTPPLGVSPGGGVQTVPQQTIPPQTIPLPTAPQPAAPQTNTSTNPSSAAPQGAIVYWDGMEIQTIAPGSVVIDTVRLGSQADRANLEPGGQLTAVNGHPLNSATDIAPAIKGLSAGKRVTVQVIYGSSSPESVSLILGAPPSGHP
jgi:membrane-associated protease RseP (regulator of RpoE activity)